ncbi:MAG: hypothetical protein AAFQ07_16015 [Chloroflexota bacterium]
MPITFEWYDKERGILLNTFSEYWTWQECIDAIDRGIVLGKQAKHVDTIIDMRASNILIPTGALRYLPILADKVAEALPHWGISVIISDSKLIKSLLTIASRLSRTVRQHYAFATTLDDALAIIEKRREKSS